MHLMHIKLHKRTCKYQISSSPSCSQSIIYAMNLMLVWIFVLSEALLLYGNPLPGHKHVHYKIHVPTKVKTVYVTKLVKVPEHHHYFHEKIKKEPVTKVVKVPEHHHYFHEKKKEEHDTGHYDFGGHHGLEDHHDFGHGDLKDHQFYRR